MRHVLERPPLRAAALSVESLRREILRKFILPFLLIIALFSSPAWGLDINIDINLGLPPPITVKVAPTMLYLSQPGIYVAVGIGFDLFFIDGLYYYYKDGRWYWASYYGEPWVIINIKKLPRGLRKTNITGLHRLRDAEYKRYKKQGPRYKGKTLIAEKTPSKKGKDSMGTQQPDIPAPQDRSKGKRK